MHAAIRLCLAGIGMHVKGRDDLNKSRRLLGNSAWLLHPTGCCDTAHWHTRMFCDDRPNHFAVRPNNCNRAGRHTLMWLDRAWLRLCGVG